MYKREHSELRHSYLTIDGGTEDEGLAFVLETRITKTEIREDTNWLLDDFRVTYAVYQLSPSLPNREEYIGSFGASYRRYPHSLSISGGDMYIRKSRLRGKGLGSYLMSQGIKELKALGIEGTIKPLLLVAGDAYDEESKERRNQFYEKFGVIFEWEDETKRAGTSVEWLTLADLKEVVTPPHVKEFKAEKALSFLHFQKCELSEALVWSKRAVKNLSKDLLNKEQWIATFKRGLWFLLLLLVVNGFVYYKFG